MIAAPTLGDLMWINVLARTGCQKLMWLIVEYFGPD